MRLRTLRSRAVPGIVSTAAAITSRRSLRCWRSWAERIVPGFEAERVSFIYNYFVLCGPSADPAGVKDADTVLDAFTAIAAGGHPFVSRGDGSGTHNKELQLWPADLGITKEAESVKDYAWYNYANAGMGACLVMAEEMGAYILTDKATFLTFVANGGDMG